MSGTGISVVFDSHFDPEEVELNFDKFIDEIEDNEKKHKGEILEDSDQRKKALKYSRDSSAGHTRFRKR